MSKLKFTLISLIMLGIIGYSCKKEPINSGAFVEKSLVGAWPLRFQIVTIVKNGKDTISPSDTTVFTPIDTVLFTEDRKFLRGTSVLDFSVDEQGENIKFSTLPDSTWNISYFRKASFKLVYERKETVGADIIIYITERDFQK